jgi:hypothetical protein
MLDCRNAIQHPHSPRAAGRLTWAYAARHRFRLSVADGLHCMSFPVLV